MWHSRLLRALSAAACIALYPIQPATAGRTVIDGGATITLSGYCSPNTAFTPGCVANSLPFQIDLGGTTFSSFYVNSNGTVSFGSIESFLAPQNIDPSTPPQTSLADYSPIPIFSPNFSDGAGFEDFIGGTGFDGNFIAQTSVFSTGFAVDWFSCIDPLHCGQVTIDLIGSVTFDPAEVGNGGLVDGIIGASTLNDLNATPQENFDSGKQALLDVAIYTMTLTGLPGGFQVDYSYSDAANGQTGTFGFHLPTAQFEVTGPLTDRSFVFNSAGALVSGVPEPSTWVSMLLGFGLAGFALRRKRRVQAPA